MYSYFSSECCSNRKGTERRKQDVTGNEKKKLGWLLFRQIPQSSNFRNNLYKLSFMCPVCFLWGFLLVNILMQRTNSNLDRIEAFITACQMVENYWDGWIKIYRVRFQNVFWSLYCRIRLSKELFLLQWSGSWIRKLIRKFVKSGDFPYYTCRNERLPQSEQLN